MTEQRYGYTYHRVLIDSTRVLDPQFDDAVIYVTGAQLELLRNMTQYLNRLSTYVSEYHPNYYLSPTIEDYDTIHAIVADLEETLMGNPNTIWGYKDTIMQWPDATASGGGDKSLNGPGCPEGEVWQMQSVDAWNNDTACSRIEIAADYPGYGTMILAEKDSPAIGEHVRWSGQVTLAVGCKFKVKFYDCVDGDSYEYKARGHLMEVPA